MKKIKYIFLVIFIVSFSILLVSCSNDDKDWKDKDINGYYTYYIGCEFFVHSWAIELCDENINDSTKTFVVRYTNDTYNDGVAEENFFMFLMVIIILKRYMKEKTILNII